MRDDIRAMTAELAAEPGSLVFLDLGEALRRRGQLDAAYKVTRTGLARYPELARAHDLCARILCDRGEPDRAFECWVTALELDPALVGAHKGLGFLYYQVGDLASAERHLGRAAEADPTDAGTAAALERLRANLPAPAILAPFAPGPGPGRAPEPDAAEPGAAQPAAEPAVVPPEEAPGLPFSLEGGSESPIDQAVFAGLDGGGDGLLLVDGNGLRLGGGLRRADGADVADAVAALLAGVSREAARTARLLSLGDWRGLAIECADANLHLSPPTASTLLLTVRGPEVPPGRVARFAERAASAVRTWMERAR
jgi:tetratricopeptide (TPR) repeat protein